MAVKTRGRSSVLGFLQFVVRFLGLNGLVAAAIGAVMWFALDYEEVGQIVVIAGGSAAALALLVELPGLLFATASHRGAAGINVVLQVSLASVLVIGGNYYSFYHHKRFDCTRDQVFTLDDKLQEKLAQLRGDTDIIIYLQHVSFGQRVDLRQDEYDQAAEKITIEKVKDMVEQFGEVSPGFRIHVLDTHKRTYTDRDKKLSEVSKELVVAIKNAPEDSVFFFSRETKQIQRLSFNDIAHLDRKASEKADDGKGNLVLIDQGVRNFANKIFRIEEKKPRIGIAVVHGFLGLEGAEEYGMPALKTAMQRNGYDGRDVVLKRLLRDPVALDREENRYEALQRLQASLKRDLKHYEATHAKLERQRDFWSDKSLDEINKEYVVVVLSNGYALETREAVDDFRKRTGRQPRTRPIDGDLRQRVIKDLNRTASSYDIEIKSKKERLAKAEEEQKSMPEERLAESRRISDVREKLNRFLNDVDLLVVPRYTVINLVRLPGGEVIRPGIHSLDDAQLEAIKDFMKAGKPVLFCLGPNPGRDGEPGNADSLEKLLGQFGVVLPNQTILSKAEGEAMAEFQDREELQSGGQVDTPPAEFDWIASAAFASALDKTGTPIRVSMRMTVNGLGENSRTGLKNRYPRPVYVSRLWTPQTVGSTLGLLSLPNSAAPTQVFAALQNQQHREFDENAVFLMTSPDWWNEDRPIIDDDWTPHFIPPGSDDVDNGTIKEKRRGPFPIGVALEADVPRDWYSSADTMKPTRVRLAVIGDGAVFIGEKLSPLKEKLFLDVSNWLLGRENLLARESATWEYPRVQLEPEIKQGWEWGTRFALPMFFVFLGANVWLVRRMR
jgi:hypothetical protein